MKTIEILIAPTGQLTVNAAGFQGADCEQATAFLEQALGQLQHRQRKPEFFQRARRRHVQELGK
jgi:Protein of unknown function (DUF2997)